VSTTVTVEPAKTDVTVSSSDAISVDLTTSSTTLEIANGGLTFNGSLPDFFDGSQNISNYVTSTGIDSASEFSALAGKKIVYTGGGVTVPLPNPTSITAGTAWVILNAGTGNITIDVDGDSVAQQVRFLSGAAVATSNSNNLRLTPGGVAELICIKDGTTNSSSKPNYLIFGSGLGTA